MSAHTVRAARAHGDDDAGAVADHGGERCGVRRPPPKGDEEMSVRRRHGARLKMAEVTKAPSKRRMKCPSCHEVDELGYLPAVYPSTRSSHIYSVVTLTLVLGNFRVLISILAFLRQFRFTGLAHVANDVRKQSMLW